MEKFRYLPGVATLKLETDMCVGCGMCDIVCPHQVFAVVGEKAVIDDLDACMECGACAVNCPVSAISVDPGVGCASYIIKKWIYGKGTQIECC